MKIRYLPFGPIDEPAWPDYFGHVVATAFNAHIHLVTKDDRAWAKWITFGCRV